MDPTKLKDKRLEQGLSQERLARILEVSYSTIANWETGKSAPSLIHAQALSKALDWPLRDMLEIE